MKINLIKFYILFFFFKTFKSDQKGATAIEYGLIALSIASMMFIALHGSSGLALAIKARFEQLAALANSVVLGL